jgi:uncharacterized repeat protein (TIGR01451 family)
MRYFRLFSVVALMASALHLTARAQQAGTFRAGVLFPSGTNQPGTIISGDFNGDGHVDAVTSVRCVGDCSQSGVAVYLNDGSGGFQAPIVTNTGPATIQSMAVKDFNRDGKLDIATISDQANSSTLAIFLGNGNGTFIQAASYAVNGVDSQPFTIASGDFNGDLKPDLVLTVGCYNVPVSGCGVGAVLVYLGNGDGTFGGPDVSLTFGNGAHPVVIADVNGDQISDIVCANQAAPNDPAKSSITVFLGTGDGTFHGLDPTTKFTDIALPYFQVANIVAADFNSDGRVDLATSGFFSRTHILFGNGDGSFQTQTPPIHLTNADSGLSATDLNGDGRPDLVVAAGSPGFQDEADILINDGTGNFQMTPYLLGGYAQGSVATGDFNADGQTDVLVSSSLSGSQLLSKTLADGTLSLLLGNGDGTLQAASILPSPGPFSGDHPAVVVADLNHDGAADVVRLNQTQTVGSVLTVFLGSGGGKFNAAPAVIPLGVVQAESALVRDFDGDGNADIAVVALCSPSDCVQGSVMILMGNGDGTFRNPASYGAGAALSQQLAAADVNGDGKLDLIAASQCVDGVVCSNAAVSLLLGNGDGTFQPALVTSVPELRNITSIAALDMNADGRADISVAGPHSPGVTPNLFLNNFVEVFLGSSTGNITFAGSYPAGGTVRQSSNFQVAGVVAGDVNYDGKPDLVTTNTCGFEQTNSGFNPCNGGTIGVLLGNGDGTFQGAVSYFALDANFASANLADVTGDGKLDLVAATPTGVYVAAGMGDGRFQPGTVYAAVTTLVPPAITVAVADINGDGAPDIAVPGIDSSRGIAETAILFNRAAFGPPPQPDLTITKSHIGNFTQGQGGAVYTITVTNQGAAATAGTITMTDTLPAGLTAIALSGPTGWICSLSPLQCTTATSLSPAATAQFTLTVNVASNAAASLVNTAIISGGGDVNGANNSSADPTTVLTAAVALSVTTLDFGMEQVGGAYPIPQVQLTNTGTGPVILKSNRVQGANALDFTESDNCPLAPATLAAGGRCTLTVDFTPSHLGPLSATVNISDSTATSPHTITLSGQAVDFSMSAVPISNTIKGGKAATYNISVIPLGGNRLGAALSVAGCPANTTCTISPGQFTLNGATASSSTLTVKGNGKTPNGAFTLTITGTVFTVSHKTTVTLLVQ